MSAKICASCGCEIREDQSIAPNFPYHRSVAHCLIAVDAAARADQRRKDAAEFAATLERYGNHAENCEVQRVRSADNPECNCGLDAACLVWKAEAQE